MLERPSQMHFDNIVLMVQWLNAMSYVSEIVLNVNIHSLTHTPFTFCASAVCNELNQNIQQINTGNHLNRTK